MDWIKRLDKVTQSIHEEFSQLNESELNTKPGPNSWSIAQVIDHLMVINSSYFPMLDDLRAGRYKAPFTSKIGFLVNMFGNLILKSTLPENKKKVKTFPIWEPSQSEISADVIERFRIHQDELKHEIQASNDWVKNGAVIHSPANRNVVYKLETAFEIIVTHEERHLQQAREILNQVRDYSSQARD